MHGFLRIPNNIFTLSLSGAEFKTYCVIFALSFASKGRYVKISSEALSYHTGLSRSSVKRALSSLIGRGAVASSVTYIDGRRTANRYKAVQMGDTRHRYTVLELSTVREYPPDKLLIYAAILRHADRRGYTYISERALASELGISKNTVRKYTSELERENVFKKEIRYYEKHHSTRARRSFAYCLRPEKTVCGSNDVADVKSPTPSKNRFKSISRARRETHKAHRFLYRRKILIVRPPP